MYGLFLSLLTASGSMDARMAAFENGSAWFGAWAEAGHGDVSPAEMAIIVEQVHMFQPLTVYVHHSRHITFLHT